VKTHTPLDGLPYFEDVAYVVCGRDPRDAFLSGHDHIENISAETQAEVAQRLGLPPGTPPPLPADLNEQFVMFLTVGAQPWMEDGFPLGSPGYYIRSFWPHRQLPNIYLLHYADLQRDLDGEMRRLSAFLNIAIDEQVWPSLVEAATFAAMKREANQMAPGAHLGEWSNNAEFFRRGRMGAWPEALSPENLALYEKLSAERLAPELKRWLEGGREGFDPAT
jgi:aryl sulfotransferase